MSNPEFEDLLKEYEKLDRKVTQIEEEKAHIKAKIQKDMERMDYNKVESKFGTFSLVTRKTWKYSEDVLTKEEKLKDLKKKEQEEGIAKATEAQSITYYPIKK